MNKISTLFLPIIIFFMAAFFLSDVAAETPKEISGKVEKDISEKEIEPLVIEAPKEATLYSEDSNLDMPTCDNARLIDDVIKKANDYFKGKPATDILTRRRNALTLKYLNRFIELDIKTLPRAENRELSDKLISYRINKGLKNADFRICKSAEIVVKPIYLLIYPENGAYIAEILNFAGPLSKGEIFSVVYD